MTVVFHSVSEWLPQTENWIYNQIRFLPDHIVPHILCEKTINKDQFLLPNIYSLSELAKTRIWVDKGFRKLGLRNHLAFSVREMRKHQAQVLHSHFGNVAWQNIDAANRLSIPHLATYYGYDVNYLPKQDGRWKKRYHQLFQSVDRILCEGPYMAKSIQALGCPPEKTIVQHLGIAVKDIGFKLRDWHPSQTLRVLIAASFLEKKGIPYAIEALGRIKHDVLLEITIIGDARPTRNASQEKQKILKAIETNGLQKNTKLLGYQNHRRLIQEAYQHHIFLSPSVTASDGDCEGGAPVSIIEMAATGMLIVGTRHCDIPEVISEGKTGLLADERDVYGLEENIRWLLNNVDKWPAILQAGRHRVEKEYDVIVQAERLANIYRSVI